MIFITCLQSLRLTPPLRAAETKFVNPPMQIREDIRNAYVINDKGISRNVVARSSFCAAAKLIQTQLKIGMIFQPIRFSFFLSLKNNKICLQS